MSDSFEWLSYSLSDLLLFSLPAYVGLFELLNTALWPVHLFTLALGIFAGVLVFRRDHAGHRLVWAVLGVCWIWTGWYFLHVQYATINWAMAYVTPVFWLQALLFALFALGPKCPEITYAQTAAARVAVALYVFALAGYPVATLALGRPLHSVEFVGISADPGVAATLAILTLSRGSFTWLAWIMPVAWCAITGLTLWMLGSAEFFIAPLAALLAVVAAMSRTLKQR